jgi:hypothetical protein
MKNATEVCSKYAFPRRAKQRPGTQGSIGKVNFSGENQFISETKIEKYHKDRIRQKHKAVVTGTTVFMPYH